MKLMSSIILLLIANGAFALNKEWWKHASIYEIYLRSFKDSDGDGIGDIKGLISKLDYLVDIGVDTIYLPPFYPSSMADGGYDITDYKGIHHEYGTMEDFDHLTKEIKSRGLYLLIDLVINHSSDEHEWFQKSVEKIAPYTDYYVWADPKGYDSNNKPIPPNNWFSVFEFFKLGSAWTWNEKRRQFYLHQCMVKQPDFNLRNEAVKKEIQDIVKFWLDKGVSGFRVDAPMIFMEDEQLRDNPPFDMNINVFNVFEQTARTFNHPDTFRFLNELNIFVRKYDRSTRRDIQTALIGESYGSPKMVIKYYGTKRFPVFHLPLNFLLTTLTKYFNARELQDYLHTWLNNLPKGTPSNWALGNHDKGRIHSYLNTEYNSILLALVTLLPGTCQIYYGEELGMGANELARVGDPIGRDVHRSPMHWDDSRNAGFSTGETPWLPVNPNYWKLNVQHQRTHKNSILNYFKELTSLRKTETAKYGDLKFYIISEWVLAFTRTYKRTSYLIMMNLGTETHTIDWPADINLPAALIVQASSPNSGYEKGHKVDTKPEHSSTSVIRPHSVVVFSSSRCEFQH